MGVTKIFIEADSIVESKMSGIGHATLQIIRELDDRLESNDALRVTIIVPYNSSTLVNMYRFKNIRVRRLPPMQKYVNYLLTRTSIPVPISLLYGRGVYIFPNYKTWWTPFSKSMMFVHDVSYKIFPETVNPKNLSYLQANFERWLKRAGLLLLITKSSAEDFKTYFPGYARKIRVVHLGVDVDTFVRQTSESIRQVHERYGIPSNYFLYVGNIEPRKNIVRLLSAYEMYVKDAKIKPAALVLVGGDGWKNEAILDKIAALRKQGYEIIRPKKYVQDKHLPALYSGAKALVHVAIHEGFGLSPLQARSCGTPLIVSEIPAIREVIGNDGGVVYVDPDNTHMIAMALSRIDSKAVKPGKHTTTLTWKNTVSKITGIIDTIDE